MRFYWLAVGILCVWRVTHLLVVEDGPWGIMAKLQRRAGSGFWAELLNCFYCLSLWTAAPLAYWLGESWRERLLLWPALSGGAILLQRSTSSESDPKPIHYFEEKDFEEDDKEENHALLRQQEKPIPSGHSAPHP